MVNPNLCALLNAGPIVKDSFDGRACTAAGSKMFKNLEKVTTTIITIFLTDKIRKKSDFLKVTTQRILSLNSS
jgi:hypothetical protein